MLRRALAYIDGHADQHDGTGAPSAPGAAHARPPGPGGRRPGRRDDGDGGRGPLGLSGPGMRPFRDGSGAPSRNGRADYGKEVTLEGTVLVPEVGAPVLLTTWAYWPMPPSEITCRSCILMPGVVGTWKPWVCTIDGSAVKLQ